MDCYLGIERRFPARENGNLKKKNKERKKRKPPQNRKVKGKDKAKQKLNNVAFLAV